MNDREPSIEDIISKLDLPSTTYELDQRVHAMLAARAAEIATERSLPSQRKRLLLEVAASILLCLLSFSAGIFAGDAQRFGEPQQPVAQQKTKKGRTEVGQELPTLYLSDNTRTVFSGERVRESAFGEWTRQ